MRAPRPSPAIRAARQKAVVCAGWQPGQCKEACKGILHGALDGLGKSLAGAVLYLPLDDEGQRVYVRAGLAAHVAALGELTTPHG